MQKCVIFDARFELNISTGTAVFYVPTFMFFLFNIDHPEDFRLILAKLQMERSDYASFPFLEVFAYIW